MKGTPDPEWHIRPESAPDQQAIYDLTKRAFAPMPFAAGNEQDLVNALRVHDALEISLVAEHQGKVVGHIAFSPAVSEQETGQYYALGPVCAEPDMQRCGIGRALIQHGLDMLHQRGAAGCVLVGSLDYYPRFGFKSAPDNCPEGEPAEYYQLLCFTADTPQGIIGFHPLFHEG